MELIYFSLCTKWGVMLTFWVERPKAKFYR